MTPFVIIGYIVITGMFILGLLAYTSASYSQRQRLLDGYAVLTVTFLGIWIYFERSNEYRSAVVDNYTVNAMAFGYCWPVLIGRLIVQQRVKQHMGPSIVHLKPDIYELTVGIVGTVFLLWVSFVYAPAYYEKPLYSNISFLLFSIPAIVLSVIMTIQKTVFHVGGILHGGMLWAWSDFHSYSWKDKPHGNSSSKLLLKIKKGSWCKNLRVTVPSRNRQIIEVLLTKNISCLAS